VSFFLNSWSNFLPLKSRPINIGGSMQLSFLCRRKLLRFRGQPPFPSPEIHHFTNIPFNFAARRELKYHQLSHFSSGMVLLTADSLQWNPSQGYTTDGPYSDRHKILQNLQHQKEFRGSKGTNNDLLQFGVYYVNLH
jgi:hypothetical protein